MRVNPVSELVEQDTAFVAHMAWLTYAISAD